MRETSSRPDAQCDGQRRRRALAHRLFKSDPRPHYGEGADALGHVQGEVITRSDEVTVLAWSGKSSSYNGCLPASFSIYGRTPYNPPSLGVEETERYITKLRGMLPQPEALSIYNQINSLPPAHLATRRLHLPDIVFSAWRLVIQGLRRGNEKLYHSRISRFGIVEFTTTDDLPLLGP